MSKIILDDFLFVVIFITMNDNPRVCKICKMPESLTEFSPERRTCRKCVSKINYQRLRSNPAKRKSFETYQKQWEHDNNDARSKYDLKWRRNNFERLLLYSARARAKKYNVECSLTLGDIIIPDVCPVFKTPIKKDLVNSNNSPSLDRMVPAKGYTKENTHVISCRANIIKNCGTRAEHEMIVSYMKENGC